MQTILKHLEMHSGFLRKYLETGFASVLDMTRVVIARHKLGFIFEVRLYVRQIVDNKGKLAKYPTKNSDIFR